MKLKIEHILDIPDSAQQFSGELDLCWIERRGERLFPESLAVGGEVANRAGVVSLRYQIGGEIAYRCERCMMQAKRRYSEQFAHTVVRALEDEQLDDAYLTAPEGMLSLDEIAGADLLLSLPQVLLCREDCKGLCPQCGADLNEAKCGCRRPSADPRLEMLNKLL